jgi:hypothetical protein
MICCTRPGGVVTVASLQALLLHRLLTERDGRNTGLARRFFRGAAKIIDRPWSIAVGTDLRFPEVRDGARPGCGSPTRSSIGCTPPRPAMWCSARHSLRVVNLLRPPISLLAPDIALRVLRGSLRGQRTAGAGGPVAAHLRSLWR